MSLSTAITSGGAITFRKDRKNIKLIVTSILTPTINLKIDQKKKKKKINKKNFFKMQNLLIMG